MAIAVKRWLDAQDLIPHCYELPVTLWRLKVDEILR
jgi:hypothetical protein